MCIYMIYSCNISNISQSYPIIHKDTLNVIQLDSVLNSNNIHPSDEEISLIKYYSQHGDEFNYNKNNIEYTIIKYNDKYIFNKTINNPNKID